MVMMFGGGVVLLFEGREFLFPSESIVVKLLILARVLAKGVESFN